MLQAASSYRRWIVVALVSVLVVFVVGVGEASAQITPLPIPDPQPGVYGLETTKTQAPPTQGATITVPGNGASFSDSPIEVRGICPTGLLVQIYNNDVMVGAVMCESGSFSLQVSLFVGDNDLKALVYDDLGQSGPSSSTNRVTYSNTNFTAFGQLVTLTSSYGRRASAAGSQLSWPLQLSGGAGPYAFSIDWGDGDEAQLMSQSLAGAINISHTYRNAGIYQVNVRVTDSNGVSAFLQLIAVSSGEIDGTTPVAAGDDEQCVEGKRVILWIPAAVALVLLIPAYWLGRRSQLVSLRNKMLKERDRYSQQ